MKVQNKYKLCCCILTVISLFSAIVNLLNHSYSIFNCLSVAVSSILLFIGYLKFFNSRKNIIFLLSPLLYSLTQLFYAIRYSYGDVYAVYKTLFPILTGIIFIIVAINCCKAFKFTMAIIVCLSVALFWEFINIIMQIVNIYGLENFISIDLICLPEFSFMLIVLSLIIFHLSKLKSVNKTKHEILAKIKTKSSEEYLYELKRLRDLKQISESEYQKRKTDILDKM